MPHSLSDVPYFWLAQIRNFHGHIFGLSSAVGRFMELKSMVISVLVGLNCLTQEDKAKCKHINRHKNKWIELLYNELLQFSQEKETTFEYHPSTYYPSHKIFVMALQQQKRK